MSVRQFVKDLSYIACIIHLFTYTVIATFMGWHLKLVYMYYPPRVTTHFFKGWVGRLSEDEAIKLYKQICAVDIPICIIAIILLLLIPCAIRRNIPGAPCVFLIVMILLFLHLMRLYMLGVETLNLMDTNANTILIETNFFPVPRLLVGSALLILTAVSFFWIIVGITLVVVTLFSGGDSD